MPEQPVRCSAMHLTVPGVLAPCGPLVACYPHALRAARRCNPLVQSTPLRRLPQADAQPAVAVPIGFGRCAVTGRFAAAPGSVFLPLPLPCAFQRSAPPSSVYESDRAKTGFPRTSERTTRNDNAQARGCSSQNLPTHSTLATHPSHHLCPNASASASAPTHPSWSTKHLLRSYWLQATIVGRS